MSVHSHFLLARAPLQTHRPRYPLPPKGPVTLDDFVFDSQVTILSRKEDFRILTMSKLQTEDSVVRTREGHVVLEAQHKGGRLPSQLTSIKAQGSCTPSLPAFESKDQQDLRIQGHTVRSCLKTQTNQNQGDFLSIPPTVDTEQGSVPRRQH